MNHARIRTNSIGASIVEFAVLLPVFITLVLGTIDAGWALYVQNTLVDAARQGARVAVTQSGVTATTIASTADTIIQNANIPTASVSVNISPVAFGAALKGDPITVTVDMPYSSASILPTSLFMGETVLTASVTMSKEY